MGTLPRCLLAGICAAALLAAVVVAHGAEPETASMVVGLAKCADCSRKNMKPEAVFNGALISFIYMLLASYHFQFCILLSKYTYITAISGAILVQKVYILFGSFVQASKWLSSARTPTACS